MKKDTPLISITMITYNHEKYISEAIQSVLNQTFVDFELIIVNDGSTDKTEEIIKAFQDSRIIYIFQENQGPSIAINEAILTAKGKYIAIASGDDISYPHRLQRQYEYISQSNYKIISSWINTIDDESKTIEGKNRWLNDINQYSRSRAKFFKDLWYEKLQVGAPTIFAERQIFIEAGLFCPTSIQLQDVDMWLKVIKKHEIFILPEKLVKYRIRSEQGNLSRNPENFSRWGFELYEISRNLFDDMPIEIFREAFSDSIRKPDFKNGIEYELEKAFIYLTHPSALVQDIAQEKLFKLLQDEKFLSTAIAEYDFSLTNFFDLTKNVNFISATFGIQYSKFWKLQKQWVKLKKLLRLV